MTERTLTDRMAEWLTNGKGWAYRAVRRQGDRGQCVHLAPNVDDGRAPTLCGIDRTANGGGILRGYRGRKFVTDGAWVRVRAARFEGRAYMGNLLGWRPSDRHICRACLHKVPR